jgi:hypothetical protein
MERSSRYCQELGIAAHAEFHTAAIKNFTPKMQPDIVLALHACDTATDDLLALETRTGARVIMSVPCCHKDLHRQQQRHQQRQWQGGGTPAPGNSCSSSSSSKDSNDSSSSSDGSSSRGLFDPLLSHGILRQRLLDLLTDTSRATLLKLAGYK